MKLLLGGVFILFFVMGFLFSSTVNIENIQFPFSEKGIDRVSPHDIVPEDKIKVYNDRVVIDLTNAKWVRLADTKSMDPVLDSTANAIEIVPSSSSEIKIGDIISYHTEEGEIIHRVISIGEDGDGWYCITKGDNNPIADSVKVRFSDVRRLLVAIIY